MNIWWNEIYNSNKKMCMDDSVFCNKLGRNVNRKAIEHMRQKDLTFFDLKN